MCSMLVEAVGISRCSLSGTVQVRRMITYGGRKAVQESIKERDRRLKMLANSCIWRHNFREMN